MSTSKDIDFSCNSVDDNNINSNNLKSFLDSTFSLSLSTSDLGPQTWATNSTTSSYIVLQSTYKSLHTNSSVNENNNNHHTASSVNGSSDISEPVAITTTSAATEYDNSTIENRSSRLRQLLDYLHEHLFFIIYVIFLSSNLAIATIGFTFINRCPYNELYPLYLTCFGIVAILRMNIYVFFPRDYLNTEMGFYFQNLLIKLDTLPLEEQNQLLKAATLIRDLKAKFQNLGHVQAVVLNFLRCFLDAVLMSIFLNGLYSFISNRYQRPNFDPSSNSLLYCDYLGYTTVYYHVISIALLIASFILTTIGYFTWWFIKRFLI